MFKIFMGFCFLRLASCAGMQTYADIKYTSTERFPGYVGVAFRHQLPPFDDSHPESETVKLELLNSNGKPLNENTWVKLQWINHEIYGFPLEGNQGISRYLLKSTTRIGIQSVREVEFYIRSKHKEFYHHVKMCTALTKSSFLKSLDKRYAFVETLASYLLDTDVENVQIRDFYDGCFYFSFLHLEDGEKCRRDKIHTLKEKLFHGDEIAHELREKLATFTSILSLNITLTGQCLKAPKGFFKEKLEWLKSAAPLLLLAAVVFIPVGISCYVCRGVRRRQTAMRQLQEKQLKEEQVLLTEEINRYKRFCHIDIDDEEETQVLSPPKWKEKPDNSKRKNFIRGIFEQYVPYSLQDKIDQGSSALFDNHGAKKVLPKKSLNPFARLLAIQTPAMKKQNQKAPKNTTQGMRAIITNLSSTTKDLGPSGRELNSKYNIDLNTNFNQRINNDKKPAVNPRLENELRRLSLSAPYGKGRNTMQTPVVKQRKSVSFMDLTKADRETSLDKTPSNAYRTIRTDNNRISSSFSCSAVDKLNASDYQRQTLTSNGLSNKMRRGSYQPPSAIKYSSRNALNVRPTQVLDYRTSNANIVHASSSTNVYPQLGFVNYRMNSIAYTRKQSVIDSMKSLAIVGKERLSHTIKGSFAISKCDVGTCPQANTCNKTLAARRSNFKSCRSRSLDYYPENYHGNETHYGSPRDVFMPGYDSDNKTFQNFYRSNRYDIDTETDLSNGEEYLSRSTYPRASSLPSSRQNKTNQRSYYNSSVSKSQYDLPYNQFEEPQSSREGRSYSTSAISGCSKRKKRGKRRNTRLRRNRSFDATSYASEHRVPYVDHYEIDCADRILPVNYAPMQPPDFHKRRNNYSSSLETERYHQNKYDRNSYSPKTQYNSFTPVNIEDGYSLETSIQSTPSTLSSDLVFNQRDFGMGTTKDLSAAEKRDLFRRQSFSRSTKKTYDTPAQNSPVRFMCRDVSARGVSMQHHNIKQTNAFAQNKALRIPMSRSDSRSFESASTAYLDMSSDTDIPSPQEQPYYEFTYPASHFSPLHPNLYETRYSTYSPNTNQTVVDKSKFISARHYLETEQEDFV